MTAWTTLSEKLSAAVGARADRTTWRGSLAMAVGFDLAQHARNRLALALVVFFIPAWIGVVRAVLPDRPVVYHSEVAGRALSVRADELITISGAINAVTLIVGFMMFTAVRRSGDFDQRPVAVAAFHRRTKDHTCRDPGSAGGVPWSVVTLAPRADGTFEVRSTTGPVVYCSQLPQCPADCDGDRPAEGTEPTEPADAPAPRRKQRTTTTTGATARRKPRDASRTTTLDGIEAAPLIR
ncbi:hypothetical protein ACIQMJ_08960 [Actinosynnema sp. NPDC091369]